MTTNISAPPVASHPLAHVDDYLEIGQKADASDVHLGAAAPPIWRVQGSLQPMWPDAPRLTGEQTVALAEAFMPEVYKEELKTRGDSDFAYENKFAVFGRVWSASDSGSKSFFVSSTPRCGRWTSSDCPSTSKYSPAIRTG